MDVHLADLDVEHVRRHGLRGFIECAWHQLESTPLIWNWHLDAICDHLEAVSESEIQNLLVTVPPGTGKTLVTSVFWPAWHWATQRPQTKFVCATYAQSLSDFSARRQRDLIASPWFVERWGQQVKIDEGQVKQVRFFENNKHGFRFSTSVKGEILGRHGDILIFDDLAKSQSTTGQYAVDPVDIKRANEFWFGVMTTRMANPATTAKVGIMQRLHHDDTAARCIESGDYEVLSLPMEFEQSTRCVTSMFRDPRKREGALLFPSRFPEEVVESLKQSLGSHVYEAQYQQRPTPRDGALFKAEHFQQWTEQMWFPKLEVSKVIQSWDLSFKGKQTSDFVCGTLWAKIGPNFMLLDCFHGRAGLADSCRAIENMSQKWPQTQAILIEDKANGAAVEDLLGERYPAHSARQPRGRQGC